MWTEREAAEPWGSRPGGGKLHFQLHLLGSPLLTGPSPLGPGWEPGLPSAPGLPVTEQHACPQRPPADSRSGFPAFCTQIPNPIPLGSMDMIAPFPVMAPQVSESLMRWPVSLPA